MNIALIGGMDRLEGHYITEAKALGVTLKVVNRCRGQFSDRVASVDGLILFTGKVSHAMRHQTTNLARSRNIPLVQCHSCGICSLRLCLDRIMAFRYIGAGI